MQKILLKYKSILYYIALVIIFLLFLILFKAKTDIIILCVIISFVFFINFTIFLNAEVLSPLRLLKKQINRINKLENLSVENNYEEKISELDEILEDLTSREKYFKINKDTYELYTDTALIVKRFIHELTTAKTFKINRNEFLGNVSHEMRTPIFAIQLSIETLLDGAVKDDNVNMDFLNRALKQTKRLRELVEDLIHISKLETGMKISKRYFEINPFIKGM